MIKKMDQDDYIEALFPGFEPNDQTVKVVRVYEQHYGREDMRMSYFKSSVQDLNIILTVLDKIKFYRKKTIFELSMSDIRNLSKNSGQAVIYLTSPVEGCEDLVKFNIYLSTHKLEDGGI